MLSQSLSVMLSVHATRVSHFDSDMLLEQMLLNKGPAMTTSPVDPPRFVTNPMRKRVEGQVHRQEHGRRITDSI